MPTCNNDSLAGKRSRVHAFTVATSISVGVPPPDEDARQNREDAIIEEENPVGYDESEG